MIRKTHQAVWRALPWGSSNEIPAPTPKCASRLYRRSCPHEPTCARPDYRHLGRMCPHSALASHLPDFLPEVSPFHFDTGMQQTSQSAEYRSSLPSSVSSPPTRRPASIPLRWTRDPRSVLCVCGRWAQSRCPAHEKHCRRDLCPGGSCSQQMRNLHPAGPRSKRLPLFSLVLLEES